MITAKSILVQWLKYHGYDGLHNDDCGHGCSDWKAIPYKDKKKYKETS